MKLEAENKTKFKDIVQEIIPGIDESNSTPVPKAKVFSSVKENIPMVANYNFMADLLQLPKTKEGFQYLLVVVDLASDAFDIEPIKNKDAKTVLEAYKKMFKRDFIKIPIASLATDGGNEFKKVFQKFLDDNHIYHKVGKSGRHSQSANVENLNKYLGRLFNGYMNDKESETGKAYNEWTDVLDKVRVSLNKYRKKKLPDPFTTVYENGDYITTRSKFKVGDVVSFLLDKPKNALGQDQSTEKFRMGDIRWSTVPKKVVKILYFNGAVPYRYMLEGMDNVSYTEKQLKLLHGENETKYVAREIIGERTNKRIKEYLVWWRGYLKADATWEPSKKLLEDGLKSYIDDYKNK